MIDTSPAIRKRMRSMIARKSPAQRLRMAAGMYDLANKPAMAGIRNEHPALRRRDMKVKLFERMYGGNFSRE